MSDAMPRARLGDVTDHGGVIMTGSFTVFINGIPAARLGDVHLCPIHDANVITTGSFTVFSDSLPAARVGDLCACGATIIAGSPNVVAG